MKLTKENHGDKPKVFVDPVLVLFLNDKNEVQQTKVVDRTTGYPIAFTGCMASSWIVGHDPSTNQTRVSCVLEDIDIQTAKAE